MALLVNHLEQISLSAKAIGELEFPPSKPFTNALLHNHEITALIRDTEPHERGLFSADSNARNGAGPAGTRTHGAEPGSRRKTAYNGGQMQSSAVARVLGNDMLRKIQSSSRDSGRGRGVDIEVLLRGVEKLCAAYEVPGAMDRVASLRDKHQHISASIERYDDKVSKQQKSLTRFNASTTLQDGVGDGDDTALINNAAQVLTEDDLRTEEAAVKELEQKKKALEARVAGLERDLGGLLR